MRVRVSDPTLLQALADDLASDDGFLVDEAAADTLVVGLIGSYRGDTVRARLEERIEAWRDKQRTAGNDVTVTVAELAPARVVLVDDDDSFRAMTRTVLGYASGIDVVGEASEGADALRLVDELAPDAAVVDLTLPVVDGIDVIRRISASSPDVRIIALTGSEVPADKIAALEAGAAHFVTKRRASLATLVDAILT